MGALNLSLNPHPHRFLHTSPSPLFISSRFPRYRYSLPTSRHPISIDSKITPRTNLSCGRLAIAPTTITSSSAAVKRLRHFLFTPSSPSFTQAPARTVAYITRPSSASGRRLRWQNSDLLPSGLSNGWDKLYTANMPATKASLSSPSSTSDLTPISTPGPTIPLVENGLTVAAEVKTKKRTRKTATETVVEQEADDAGPKRKRARKKTTTAEVNTAMDETTQEVDVTTENGNSQAVVVKKTRAKRKTKAEQIVEPLQPRTADTKLCVGAHVSAGGGIHNAITNCVHIGANAFALFLKSQRKWANPDLLDESVTLFTTACEKHSITPGSICLPHGSYLVNLAHPDPNRSKQAYDSFFDDLTRCHKLGIKLYNFHPGNVSSTTREDGIANIAAHLNNAHNDPATGSVITVLETMASLGNTIGGTFEDLAEIIALVDDKDRVGVCLDTCHVFAAGYDLRTPEALAATLKQFDDVIGLKYLKALHVNDSKAPFQSYRDLHARIGTGYLGLRAFHTLVNEPRLWGLPMILETPIDIVDENGKKGEDRGIWAREIKMLESLVGMDMESQEFKEMEERLSKKGEGERERIMEQVARKKEKTEKAANGKAKRASKKKVKDETETEEEESDEE